MPSPRYAITKFLHTRNKGKMLKAFQREKEGVREIETEDEWRGQERETERENEKYQTFQPQPYKLAEHENMNEE